MPYKQDLPPTLQKYMTPSSLKNTNPTDIGCVKYRHRIKTEGTKLSYPWGKISMPRSWEPRAKHRVVFLGWAESSREHKKVKRSSLLKLANP